MSESPTNAEHNSPPLRGSSDPLGVMALGFGTSVAMWAVAFVCLLPRNLSESAATQPLIPRGVLLFLLVICLLGGGFFAGRYLTRGWQSGGWVGLVASTVNLLILGSLVTEHHPGVLIPCSMLLSIVVCGIGGGIGQWTRKAAPRDESAARINWRLVYAAATSVAVLLTLVAGGLVTGFEQGLAVPDWPGTFERLMFVFPLSMMTGGVYIEHAHRLAGSLAGLAVLVLAISTWLGDRRRWMKIYVTVAFIFVCVQGFLGGARVLEKSTALAAAHGVFAHVFFALIVLTIAFTSGVWNDDRRPHVYPTTPTDRGWAGILIGMLVIQIALGAFVRHFEKEGLHAVMTHITVAVLVMAVALTLGLRAWKFYAAEPVISRLGLGLVHLVGVQMILGFAAFFAVRATRDAPRPSLTEVLITSAHHVVGALLLACSALVLVFVYRLLAPGEQPGEKTSQNDE